MTQEALHTKGPLYASPTTEISTMVRASNGAVVCDAGYFSDAAQCDANAARIVKTWNSHDALVAALEACDSMLGDLVTSGRATEQTRTVARKVVAALAAAA